MRDCDAYHPLAVDIGQLLRDFGLTPEAIGRLAECATDDVVRALNPQQFQECPLILVARVRAMVELSLAAQGWRGEVKALWKEFDARLAELKSCNAG